MRCITAPSGAEFAEVQYPDECLERIAGGRESMEGLASSYGSTHHGRATDGPGDGRPLVWPLYSNQPSLNDADFIRALPPFPQRVSAPPLAPAACPFREGHDYTPSGRYWLFEFELGLRFVMAGGRKGSLMGSGLARQINVTSSSGAGGEQRRLQEKEAAATFLQVPSADPHCQIEKTAHKADGGPGVDSGAAVNVNSWRASMRHADTQLADGRKILDVELCFLSEKLASLGSSTAELVGLTARNRALARGRLEALGVKPLGERLRMESMLLRLV